MLFAFKFLWFSMSLEKMKKNEKTAKNIQIEIGMTEEDRLKEQHL